MSGRYKGAVAGIMATMMIAGSAQAATPAPSVLSLSNAANVQVPAGARIGAKRGKSESKAAVLGLPVLAVVAGAAAVTVGVVAIASGGNSDSP